MIIGRCPCCGGLGLGPSMPWDVDPFAPPLGFAAEAAATTLETIQDYIVRVTQRAPLAGEAEAYAAQVASGALTLDQVLADIVHGHDAVTFVCPVIQLYQAVYGRVPDPGGLEFWTNSYRSLKADGGDDPATPDIDEAMVTLAKLFVDPNQTPEFAQRFGIDPSPAAYVDSLYTNVLNRPPDAEGHAFWTSGLLSLLSHGVDLLTARAIMLERFVNSTEFKAAAAPYVTAFLTDAGRGTEDYSGSLWAQLQYNLTVDDAAIVEGNAGTSTVTLTLMLDRPVSGPDVVVHYQTNPGTATPGEDYVSASGTVVFQSGQQSKQISLTIKGDTNIEPDETFTVSFSSDLVPDDTVATVTIISDDYGLTVASVETLEGQSGSHQVTMTLTLDRPVTGDDVVVHYQTVDGSAVAGLDYEAASGEVVFQAGEQVKQITLTIHADDIVEPNETFDVVFTSDLVPFDTVATVTILSEEYTLNVGNVQVLEGNSGTTPVTLTLTLDRPVAGTDLVVFYNTVNGTAMAGQDYQGVSGYVVFQAGEQSKQITVDVFGDTVFENNETFSVVFSSAAIPSGATATVTILNDDSPPVSPPVLSITALDANKPEGDSGFTPFTFRVTRSGDTSGTNSVDWTVGPGSNPSADAADFGGSYPSGTVVFNPGETTKTITIYVQGDTLAESGGVAERFNVTLANPSGGATLSSTQRVATGFIQDDDSPTFIYALLTPQQYKWGNSPVGSPVEVTYSFLTALPSYYSTSDYPNFAPMNATQQQVVMQILQMYEGVANIKFTQVSGVGQITFGTADLGANIAGEAYYPPSTGTGGANSAHGDVWITNRYASYANPSPGSWEYLAFIHEIGHAIGLKHPGNYNAGGGGTPPPYLPASQDSHKYTVMSYNSGPYGNIEPTTPQLFDVAAVQFLYGANNSTRSGNTTYTFANNEVKTIWDGGGIDTIDASNFTTNLKIDLRPGTFSTIGTLNENIAIAYDTFIEKAIGGFANDTIIANQVANTLTGGPGNDTFIFNIGMADGDTILDFNGNGAGAGDVIRFLGYGTADQGASFIQIDDTHWRVTSYDQAVQEIIILANGASVHPSDIFWT